MKKPLRFTLTCLIASNITFGLLLWWQVVENQSLKSEATGLRENSPAAILGAERERHQASDVDLTWTTIRYRAELEVLCGPPIKETPLAAYWVPRHAVQLTTAPGPDPVEIRVRAQLPSQRTDG